MDTINKEYSRGAETPSDINEHMPTLRRYAAACPHGQVAELGVRGVVSTWALLAGLADRRVPGAHLWSVDIAPVDIGAPTAAAKTLGIDMTFIQTDSATVELPEVDMMFIDTWHVYAHLRRELAKHAPRVRMWILLHDTEGDRDVGETVRLGQDARAQAMSSGYQVAEITQGLRRAVLEFLTVNNEWDVVQHYRNNNGLSVLARRGTGAVWDTPVVSPVVATRPSSGCRPHAVCDTTKALPVCRRQAASSPMIGIWCMMLLTVVFVVLLRLR